MAQTASPADITAVQNILKEVYTTDTIVGQLDTSSVLYSQLEKTTDYHDSVGNVAVGFVKTGRNVGTSARSLNGGTLGAAGHQGTNRWTLDYSANYLQLKILGTTIAKMKTARQAAVREVNFEVEEGLNDMRKELQRQLHSDGSALICRTAASGPSTTVTLYAAATQDARNSNDTIIKGWLQPGMYVDIGTTANQVSIVQDAKISSVTDSESAPTVVIDSSVTTTTSTYISKASNRSGTTSYELNGLQNLVDDSATFGGLAPGTVPSWKSPVVDNSGTSPLARSNMQAAWRKIAQASDPPNLILTSLESQEAYYNLLQSQVRFAGDANLASGKVDGPLFNQTPVTADPDCPRQFMYFLNTKTLLMCTAGDIAWQNQNTGGDILAWVQGEDAFVARAAYYAQLGTTKRRGNAKVKAIQVA